jgi:hypothetical protein
MMSFHKIIWGFGDFVDRIYPIAFEIKDPTHTHTDRSAPFLDLHFEIDTEGRLRTKLYDKRDDFNFPIVNFPFICNNISTAPAYGVYIYQLIRYSRACGSYQDFLGRELLLTRSYWAKSSSWLSWNHHFEILRSPPWLGWPLWNSCVTNDHWYVPLVVNTSGPFPHSRLITGIVTRLTRRVSLVEQELPTFPEHMSSPTVFSGIRVTRSLVVYVCFVDRCLPICTFSFGHCICSSSIYEFWLPLWYLHTFLIGIMKTVCWAKAKVQ